MHQKNELKMEKIIFKLNKNMYFFFRLNKSSVSVILYLWLPLTIIINL